MKDTNKYSKSKIFLIVFNSLLSVAIIVSSMMIVIDKARISKGLTGNDSNADSSQSENVEPVDAEPKGTTTARLMCAGDNLIHGSIYKQARSRAGGSGYDFSYAYDNVRDIIGKADIAFLNQETIMDSDSEPSSYPLFNSPTELLDEMTSLGFNVFNQATNHVMDKGVSGAQNDLALFQSKNNVLLTGLYQTWEDMMSPKTIDANGITFSFVGFTEYLNGLYVPSDSDLGLVYLTDKRHTQDELYSTMETMIKNSKEASDIVCVSMHWQTEDVTEPTESEKAIVEKLLAYGADIIIGTGPHVMQPMEYMQNGDGEQALVIWSLGNFISCQNKTKNLLGGISDITVTKDYDTGKTSVTSASLIPTITHYTSSFSNVRIIPLSDYSDELAYSHGIRAKNSSYDMEYIENFYNEMFPNQVELDP